MQWTNRPWKISLKVRDKKSKKSSAQSSRNKDWADDFYRRNLINIYGLYYANPIHLTIVVNVKHMMIPVTVGTRNETAVHFKLWVSFFMVRHVVLQGQCINEKSITFTAVSQVHPFATRRFLKTEKSSISSNEPWAI